MTNPWHEDGFDFWLYPAKTEKPEHLIVILHGHGSRADIYRHAAEQLQRAMPGAEVIALQAPLKYGASGHTWFDYAQMKRGLSKSWLSQIFNHLKIADDVNAFTSAQLAKRGLTPDNLALIGNSLGGIVAVQAGFHGKKPPAAVVCRSGAVLPFTKVESVPDLLILMGEKDEIFWKPAPPPKGLKKIFAAVAKRFSFQHPESLRRLRKKGVPFTEKTYPGEGHLLGGQSWDDATDFVAAALKKRKSPKI